MDKYKKLMGNTVVFGIGQLLSKVIGFFLVALYTKVLKEAEYSTTDLIYNTVNMLFPIVTLSMSDAIIRFGMDKAYDARKVFTCACTAVLGGMTVFMLFTPLVAHVPSIGSYSVLMYIYLYFSCFRQMASQFVRAMGKVKLFMIDGVLSTFMQLILNLIFLLGFKWGVGGYILSIIFSDALSICFLTYMGSLHRCIDSHFFDKGLFKEMLRFSAPLIPTYLLWWITSASDRWFVIGMIGETENGIYSVGYKLPTLLMLVTTMFYQAWQMSSIEERDSRTLNKFYENVFGAYSSLIFIGASGLIMLVKPLTMLLTGTGADGSRYHEAFAFTPILIVSMVFQCFCQFLSSVYTTKKRSVNSCLTAIVAAAVNILLNALLIPAIGVWGAAIATASSYFACFLVRLFDTRRFIFFRVDYIRLAVNTALVIIMCVLVGMQKPLWWLGIIIGCLICIVYNFAAVIKTLRRILARRGNKA